MLLLRLYRNIEHTKFPQNFDETICENFHNNSPPTWAFPWTQRISSEITYSMLSNIYLNLYLNFEIKIFANFQCHDTSAGQSLTATGETGGGSEQPDAPSVWETAVKTHVILLPSATKYCTFFDSQHISAYLVNKKSGNNMTR